MGDVGDGRQDSGELRKGVELPANQTVPNLVVAKAGADGKVAVYNNAGSAHVILDVVGWARPT